MVKNTPPTADTIRLMQQFYDEGNSLRKTEAKFSWSRVTLLKYLKTRNTVVSDEEKRLRRIQHVVSWRTEPNKNL